MNDNNLLKHDNMGIRTSYDGNVYSTMSSVLDTPTGSPCNTGGSEVKGIDYSKSTMQ